MQGKDVATKGPGGPVDRPGNGRTVGHIALRETPPATPCAGPYGTEEDLRLMDDTWALIKARKSFWKKFDLIALEYIPFLIIFFIAFLWIIPGAKTFIDMYLAGILAVGLVFYLVYAMQAGATQYYRGQIAADILPDIENPETRSDVEKLLGRKDLPRMKDAANAVLDPIPDFLYVLPISRDTYPLRDYREGMMSKAKECLKIAVFVGLCLYVLRYTDPLLGVRAFLITLMTTLSATFMTIYFKLRYMIKWPAALARKVKRFVKNALIAAISTVFAIIPLGLLVLQVVGHPLDWNAYYLPMFNHPAMLAIAILPVSLSHMILDGMPAWYFLIAPMLFWALGFASIWYLREVDYVRVNRLSVVQTMAEIAKNEKEEEPEVTPIGEENEAPGSKPYSADWDEFDAGEGPGVIETKRRILNPLSRPLLANALLCLAIIIPVALIRAVFNPDFSEPVLLMIPLVGALMLLMGAGEVQQGFVWIKGELVNLQLFPISSWALIWQMLKRPLIGTLIDYYIGFGIVMAILGILTPDGIAIFLLIVPMAYVYILMLWLSFRSDSQISRFDYFMFFFKIICLIIFSLIMLVSVVGGGLSLLEASLLISVLLLCAALLHLKEATDNVHRTYLRPTRWRTIKNLKGTLVAIVLVIVLLLPFGLAAGGVYIIKDLEPLDVDRKIDGAETITNSTVQIHGSLVVPAGARLEVTNSTIVFIITQSSKTGLYVERAGQLILENSTITSRGHFVFEIRGPTIIESSNITRLWGETQYEDDGGIVINTRSAYIHNSTISESLGNGITVDLASPHIEGCLITRNLGRGIDVDSGNPTIEGNTIVDNGGGIRLEDSSKPNIFDNNISRNHGNGISTEDSFPTVTNNSITWNEGSGIYIDGGDPKLTNNTITDNRGGSFGSNYNLLPSIIIFLVLILVPPIIIGYIYEKTVRRKKPESKIPHRKI